MAATERLGRCRPWKYQSRALGADDVEVAVACCAVSRVDLLALDRDDAAGFPLVPGQEVVGFVSAVGADVKTLAVGDRVGVGAQHWACGDRAGDCPECAVGADAYCRRAVFACQSRYADGAAAHGGFADCIRVAARFAFRVPEVIPTRAAAPLFGAGLAVFTALRDEKVAAGDRVGVVGIGGLGHLALQFVLALGATPVALSSCAAKEADARQLGADEFYCTAKRGDLARVAGSLDLVLLTTAGRAMDEPALLALLRPLGALVRVSEPTHGAKPPTSLVTRQGLRISASRLGSARDARDMLRLVGDVNLRPCVAAMGRSQANEALAMLRLGKARYRIVLEREDSAEDPACAKSW